MLQLCVSAPQQAVVQLNVESANALANAIEDADWRVTELVTRRTRRKPPAPFITSTLQQEGNRKLRLTSKVRALKPLTINCWP
jgi:DNA topoisomerase I